MIIYMVRNLTRVRKNKSKGKKMQTRKRTTTKKGGKKQTKQNKKHNKKHNKKQGGRKTYKKRGGDNGDSGNMGEKNIDEIQVLETVRGNIYLGIKQVIDKDNFLETLNYLHNKYNVGRPPLTDDFEVNVLTGKKFGPPEKVSEKYVSNLRTDLEKHIFGDKNPKKLDNIDVDTLINLPTFQSLFENTLTPDMKNDIQRVNAIRALNNAIDAYNTELIELKLVESNNVEQEESKKKGLFSIFGR